MKRGRYVPASSAVRTGMRHPAPSPGPVFRRSSNTIQYTSFISSLCAAPYGEVPPVVVASSFDDDETVQDPLSAQPDHRGARSSK